MDGFMAFAGHLPAGQAKLCPGATEMGGTTGAMPCFVGKRGHVKEKKIKSTLHHWLPK